MRRLLWFVVACGSPTKPSPVAPPLANATKTCADAAVGLERATRSVRAPETPIAEPMRVRCTVDAWPVAAIDCFAVMHEGELGRCAGRLTDPARDALFVVLGGGSSDRAAIAVARARLETLVVGVPECDRFVAAVAALLACEQMPIDARARLGTETATFWDLPTHGLSADAQGRMAEVCGASLGQLQARAVDAGCAP